MRHLLLMLPILLTLLVSGCTTDNFCIPGLNCGSVREDTHDVVVIETLQALPANVAPDGSIKLIAVVSNVADIDAEIDSIEVIVELYDYCSGLFNAIETKDAIKNVTLLRGEKQQVDWNLKAKTREEVPVKTECDLKVRARYAYATKSITTLHMIDYAEMQRRINEGTFSEISSYTSVGYGPIKPYIMVEGSQPIPIEDDTLNTVLSVQVKNRGKGFLSSSLEAGPVITDKMLHVHVTGADTFGTDVGGTLNKCIDEYFKAHEDGMKLIRGESTKILCSVTHDVGNVPVESTKTLTAMVGTDPQGKFEEASVNAYWYEFRKEIKVAVEPRF